MLLMQEYRQQRKCMAKLTADQLIKKLKKLKKSPITNKDLLDYGHIAVLERKRGFENSEGADGNKWEPLSSATLKTKKSGNSKPLIDSGKLQKATVEVSNDQAIIKIAKSREDISSIHQNGGYNMPARPHWGIYPKAEFKIIKRFMKKVLDALKAI